MLKELYCAAVSLLMAVTLMTGWASADGSFLAGDLNGDKSVDVNDLWILQEAWLAPVVCSEEGLVAHWKLDEAAGVTAFDASGYGRNGTVNGSAAWLPNSGKFKGAIKLDGEGDYVEITDYKGVLGSGPRTCAAWIKTTGQNVAIAGWGMVDPTGTRWAMVVDAAGRLRQEFGGGYVLGRKIINDGTWH
ncbi:MAG: hypothetical protein IH624_13475, partial [Phycisphaerae bacterium]|nr:hypothetical protein [Phycisphaerae bacterium]